MKLVKKTDFIIVGVILAAALAIFLIYGSAARSKDLLCEIRLNGEIIKTTRLTGDAVFSLEEKPQVVFEIKDGKIAFIHSDCPDKICVRSGFLGTGGQTAACLPNRLVIRIVNPATEHEIIIS